MQMEKHIQVLGILHIVYSAIGLILGTLVLLLFLGIGTFVGSIDMPDAPVHLNVPALLFTVGSVIAILLFVFSIPGIIGGIGLLKRRNWARILVLIIGFLDLIHIPLGTLLGIYTIWALMNDEAIKLFDQKTPA